MVRRNAGKLEASEVEVGILEPHLTDAHARLQLVLPAEEIWLRDATTDRASLWEAIKEELITVGPSLKDS